MPFLDNAEIMVHHDVAEPFPTDREGMGNAQGVYVGFGSNQIRSSVSRHYDQIPVFSGSILGVHGISRYLGFEI